MRLDKYLKVSRIIKRRTVAKEVCESGRVFINGKIAKAGSEVEGGDIIEINYAGGAMKVRVVDVSLHALKNEAKYMYEIINE